MIKNTNIRGKDTYEYIKFKNDVFNNIFSTYFNKLSKEGNEFDINILKKSIKKQFFDDIIEECIIDYNEEILGLQKIVNLYDKNDIHDITFIKNFNIIIKDLNHKIELLKEIK